MDFANIDFLLPMFNTEPNANLNGSFCLDNNNNLIICIYKNNKWCWEKLNSLSAGKFLEIRSLLNNEMINIIKAFTNLNQREQESSNKNGYYTLFNRLSNENKKQHLEQYKNDILSKNVCVKCFKLVDKKLYCIHKECSGGCSDCFKVETNGNKTICNICNKEQLLECPICYKKRDELSLHFLKNCSHFVCKVCLADAWLLKKPFKKCPMCRAKFT